jgi:lysophospholipase-3
VAQVGFFGNLTRLIEEAVSNNDRQPATIVAHSLGCLVSVAFLTRQPPDWVAQHVDSLVAISGPWAGSVTALKGASGVLA